jgi:hypothetical protein
VGTKPAMLLATGQIRAIHGDPQAGPQRPQEKSLVTTGAPMNLGLAVELPKRRTVSKIARRGHDSGHGSRQEPLQTCRQSVAPVSRPLVPFPGQQDHQRVLSSGILDVVQGGDHAGNVEIPGAVNPARRGTGHKGTGSPGGQAETQESMASRARLGQFRGNARRQAWIARETVQGRLKLVPAPDAALVVLETLNCQVARSGPHHGVGQIGNVIDQCEQWFAREGTAP